MRFISIFWGIVLMGIALSFDLKDEVKIIEVDSDYFSREYFAQRPDCERLINKNLNDLGFNIISKLKNKDYNLLYGFEIGLDKIQIDDISDTYSNPIITMNSNE